MKMETTMVLEEEDIVIVGAGIAGLTTALGLHRMGLRSLVLESSESLRVTGFAFTTWTNAWKALDAIGIGDPLRQQHDLLQGLEATSTVSGLLTSRISFVKAQGKLDEGHEVRCVGRKMLLETLEKELPAGTIRFCSKVVSIEEDGYSKLVHLEDGCTFKTKVLIGCDGVNSVVAKWLGLQLPAFTGRCAIRGFAEFHENHHFESKFMQYFGDGFRSGFLPCNQTTMYWFFTYTPSVRPEISNSTVEESTAMKQFVLNNLGKVPKELVEVVEKTDPESIVSSPLRLRWPWSVLWGDINKGNVCVAGDALHPMTPDIGQGGCAALEDGVVLARCLTEALLASRKSRDASGGKEEASSIKKGLERYAKERRWRSCELITTAYVVGLVQQSSGKLMNTIRDKILSTHMGGILLKRADFDCGKLAICDGSMNI